MNYRENQPILSHKLFLNKANTIRLVNHSQIIYIEANDNYSKIFLDDRTQFMLSKTLGVLEGVIDHEMFFRCHRTYLVNLFYIKEISKGRDMFIILKNGSKIPLARRRLGDLRRLISPNPAGYSK